MYHRFMVPIDGSATSARGLDEAIKLARLTGASLRLVHVIETMEFVTGFEPAVVYLNDALPAMKRAAEKILEEAKARAAAAGVTANTCMIQSLGPRVSELAVEQAKACKADLIVIGTHGRRGVGRLMLGSDAEQIARLAPVPVLLVRASEAEGKGAMPA
jgi:nucleotide-binding universal stress UspA family protein